ncbi:MAG: glycosyltransferase [Cellvibrionaceae bacterium]|nr:glycosyltransferase [Cellvibrionaceae bacterium]MAZ89111.1 glycosyltransferase [Cellvibrionaceae bacterium]|tara:strand:+ start:11168 stop:12136 length:969 start_codon:yes stop_codon:yes gene_type:complete
MTKPLRVLALTQSDRMPNWDLFYEELGNYVDLDFRKLNRSEQSNLKKYFRNIDLDNYDRIFLELRFKRQLKQRNFIATLPNLVEYESDANQNYKKGGKYQGKWSKYYSSMSSLRIICTGHIVTARLRDEGYDAVCVPKGFNETEISCLDQSRDIQLGFIGRVEKAAYNDRKKLLDLCVKRLGLQMLRTNPGAAYNQMLNRIRFFVSADIGLDEYMIKNFEAMAAGCVLCCYRQGRGEEDALGFIDMDNVVLYDDVDELEAKLDYLKGRASEVDLIAERGRALVESRYGLKSLARQTAEVLVAPVMFMKPMTMTQKLLARLGR